MNKARTRGSKSGKCNICGKHERLTNDHVPPRGSLNSDKVKIRTLTQAMDKLYENSEIDSRIISAATFLNLELLTGNEELQNYLSLLLQAHRYTTCMGR